MIFSAAARSCASRWGRLEVTRGEHIGGCQEPRFDRKLARGRLTVVTGSVEAFVMARGQPF